MNSFNEVLETAFAVIRVLLHFVVLGGCIYYFYKTKRVEGAILSISAFLTLIYYPLSMIMVRQMNTSNMDFANYSTILNVYGILNLLLYAIGFILLIVAVTKPQKRHA